MLLVRGFTLIELLVVITIVCILSAVAIPAYDRYIVKAHVSGLITAAHTYKGKLMEDMLTAASASDSVYNLNTEVIDKITTQTLDTEPIKYVVEVIAKMKTAAGAGIGLRQPRDAAGPLTIQLHGEGVGDVITWSCHVAAEYNDYVPANCKNNSLEELRSS